MSGTSGAPRTPNQELHAAALERLAAYLTSVDRIPERNGKANLSAIAIGAEVRRDLLYQDAARALVDGAVRDKGLGMPAQQRAPEDAGGEVPAWARQRIKHLEEQLTLSRTENAALRARLQHYEHLERHMTATGMLPR